MEKKLSNLAQAWASNYPEEQQMSMGCTYVMGGLTALELLDDVLQSQKNLISQVAWDRIQNAIHEIKN